MRRWAAMSSLWENATVNNLHKRPSPKQYSSNVHILLVKRFEPLKILLSNLFFPLKRTSVPASMTLEAAVVLPLFLFFFLNLFTSVEMIRLHGNLQLALWETGSRMAVYGYAYDTVFHDDETLYDDTSTSNQEEENPLLQNLMGIAFSYIYVKGEIIEYCGKEYLNQSPLTKGTDSLTFLETSIMNEDDCIDLTVTYRVSPLFSVPGFSSFRMVNRYYGRAWTGYDVSGGSGDDAKTDIDYVYITETGTVYHESLECSHLKLSVRQVSLVEALTSQNNAGSRYTLCQLCRNMDQKNYVYVTSEGARYHYDSGCSGLKRTIYTIIRTEAEDYRPCSRCAGKG